MESMKAMQPRFSAAFPVIALLVLVLGGCHTSRPLHAAGNPTYISLYRAGAYNEAYEAAMEEIHAILPDGTVVSVEVLAEDVGAAISVAFPVVVL